VVDIASDRYAMHHGDVIRLADNRYGKSAIRLVKIVRGEERHIVRDLTIAIPPRQRLRAHTIWRQRAAVIATDTIREHGRTPFAKDHLDGAIEGVRSWLAGAFRRLPQVDRATGRPEHHWSRSPPRQAGRRRRSPAIRRSPAWPW
jgi:hypothetical protein